MGAGASTNSSPVNVSAGSKNVSNAKIIEIKNEVKVKLAYQNMWM